MLDALYSHQAAVVMLLLEDRLLRYDPDSGEVDFIALPQSPLAFSEFDGELVIGFEDRIYKVDLQRGTLGQQIESPVPARNMVLSSGRIFLRAQGNTNRRKGTNSEGLWILSFSEGSKAEFAPLDFFGQPTLERGGQGLILFDRNAAEFRQFAVDVSGRPQETTCRRKYLAGSRRIWSYGTAVFLEYGQKLDLDPMNCPQGERSAEADFLTRLPVVQIAALCARPEFVAVIQDPGIGNGYRPLTPAEANAPARGTHVEIFSDPLPKRLAALPLPALEEEGGKPAWGRYVFCDGAGRRLFVVLQDGSWDRDYGIWGIATIDLVPLQDKLKRSMAWAKLIH